VIAEALAFAKGGSNENRAATQHRHRGSRSRLIKTPDVISERPPHGGLSVCAVCCGALVAIGTSLRSPRRSI
jgi:hypothetical protein